MILSRSGRGGSCTQRTCNYCMLLTVAFVTEPRVSEEAWQAQKILPCACQQSLPKPAINGPFRRKKAASTIIFCAPKQTIICNKVTWGRCKLHLFLGSELNPETAWLISTSFFHAVPYFQPIFRCFQPKEAEAAWTCVTWAVSHEARQPLQVERSKIMSA